MKIAYCTPVETGRKHIEDMFRKQPNIMKKKKTHKNKNTIEKKQNHALQKKQSLKLPTPRKPHTQSRKAGKVNLALT